MTHIRSIRLGKAAWLLGARISGLSYLLTAVRLHEFIAGVVGG